jgi:hypothetical protein
LHLEDRVPGGVVGEVALSYGFGTL